ncbi:hypothetical protein GCM10009633_19250 [Janibacter melonis]|uniref:hypothetical protein n=1 Tax=Janibacter melonis TaxID=262209 RepID=UPI001E2C2423|nr:hypothetical protein [Janibacter melonis]MCB5991757.1 hypothetical protein [Janibacter melonis]
MADRVLSDVFWDLRDDAYDRPERWQDVSPVDVFQRLAELVDEAEQGQVPHSEWGSAVAARMIAWRAGLR